MKKLSWGFASGLFGLFLLYFVLGGDELASFIGNGWTLITFWAGMFFFVGGLISFILGCYAEKKDQLAPEQDEKLVDAICAIIEPDVDPVDVTGEVPVVEAEEGGNQVTDKESNRAFAKAQKIAKNRWKVVQVVLVLDRDDDFRAMIALRSTVDNSCKALDIPSTHDHGEDFFCLEQGQEVKLCCVGTNFNPLSGVPAIPADFLRVVKKDYSNSFTLEYESEGDIGLGQ